MIATAYYTFLDFLDWASGQPGWNRTHRATWVGLTEIGAAGLTVFQERCEAALHAAVTNSGHQVARRHVERIRDEPVITIALNNSELSIWIYASGAEVGGPNVEVRLEEWDAVTPDDLIERFCRAVTDQLTPVVARAV
jgi:hypothetical protein